MTTEFTPKDFDLICDWPHSPHNTGHIAFVVQIANIKLAEIKKAWLEELMEKALVVYGCKTELHDKIGYQYPTLWEGLGPPISAFNFKARLVCIEKLEGE